LSGPPAGATGLSHGVDLRYGYRFWRVLQAGLAAQVAYGAQTQPAGSDPLEQNVVRAAFMGTLAAEYRPVAQLALRLETALGWQLLSGNLVIGNQAVAGAETHGYRLEAGAGIAYDFTSFLGVGLGVGVRGGFALDGVHPTDFAPTDRPTGYFTIGMRVLR
jgi:hypothetical protein